MHCMKCGQKVKGRQVFCDDCLDIMDQYPVKPGTPIQLPIYTPPAPPAKAPRKRAKKPEELIHQLRFKNRCLTAAFLIAFLAFLFTAVMIFWMLKDGNCQFPLRIDIPS